MAKRFAWGTGDGRKLDKGLGVAYRLKVGSFKNHHMVGDKPQRNEGWRLKVEDWAYDCCLCLYL